MYRYFILSESTIVEGCTSREYNTHPLDKKTCELKLAQALKAIAMAGGRRVIDVWMEEVTE